MKKNLCYQIVVLFALLFIVLIGFAYFSGNKSQISSINTDIDKNLKISSIFGNDVNLLAVKQPYILHFFASWCKSCAIDHNTLLQYKNTLPIYAVGSLDEPSKVRAYLVKHQNPYLDVIEDPFGSVAKYFKISGLPETVLINNNSIIMHIKGPIKASELEEKIIPLFKGF